MEHVWISATYRGCKGIKSLVGFCFCCALLLCTASAADSPAEKNEGAVRGAEGREHQGQQQAFFFSLQTSHAVSTRFPFCKLLLYSINTLYILYSRGFVLNHPHKSPKTVCK